MASNIIVHNPFFFIFSYFSFLVFTQAQQKDSIVCGKSGRPDVIVCFVKTLSEKSSMIKSESAISPGCFGLGRNRLPVIYIDQTSFYEMARASLSAFAEDHGGLDLSWSTSLARWDPFHDYCLFVLT